VCVYLIYAFLTKEIFKFQYFNSALVAKNQDPDEFWSVFYLYAGFALWGVLYSVVGFPAIERYFKVAQAKQNRELAQRTIKQKLLIYVAAPLFVFFGLCCVFLYVNKWQALTRPVSNAHVVSCCWRRYKVKGVD
jgi:signal transduction histidine kinase